MKRIEVTRAAIGIVHMQLCAESDVTDAELLEVANRENPSGTTHGWTRIIREGEGALGPCQQNRGRTHFLAVC